MFSVVRAIHRVLAAALQTLWHLVLETPALRHQLLVLKCVATTPASRNSDLLYWAVLSTMSRMQGNASPGARTGVN